MWIEFFTFAVFFESSSIYSESTFPTISRVNTSGETQNLERNNANKPPQSKKEPLIVPQTFDPFKPDHRLD